jgi:hypothetical protein
VAEPPPDLFDDVPPLDPPVEEAESAPDESTEFEPEADPETSGSGSAEPDASAAFAAGPAGAVAPRADLAPALTLGELLDPPPPPSSAEPTAASSSVLAAAELLIALLEQQQAVPVDADTDSAGAPEPLDLRAQLDGLPWRPRSRRCTRTFS